MVKVYRSHFPNIKLYKDAQKVLPEMKKRYRVGLITDGIKKVQEKKVEALNIKDLFDVITYAIEHGGKNNIQPFQATLEKLGVEPSESIYIGDSPLKGFDMAKKLGIHTIRILRGEYRDREADKRNKPQLQIKDLHQLLLCKSINTLLTPSSLHSSS